MFYYNNILNKFYFSINLLILRFGPQNIIIILYISYVLCLYIFNIYMLLDFSIYQIFDIYENYTMYINNDSLFSEDIYILKMEGEAGPSNQGGSSGGPPNGGGETPALTIKVSYIHLIALIKKAHEISYLKGLLIMNLILGT